MSGCNKGTTEVCYRLLLGLPLDDGVSLSLADCEDPALFGEGVASFDMARLGVGLNRKDGRINPVQPGADIVIPAGSDKMIFPIPTVELDAQR